MANYATIAMNPTIGDWDGQVSMVRRAIDEARKEGADVLVFPELAIGAPDAGDLFWRPDTAEAAENALAQIAPLTTGITLVIGAPISHNGKLYNVAAVFHDGLLLALVPKRYPTFHTSEERWFSRWDFKRTEQHLGAVFGNYTPRIPGLERTFVITGTVEDYPNPESGATYIIVCNRAYAIGAYREELARHMEYSRALSVTMVKANLLGSDNGTMIYDGGGYILKNGQFVAMSPRFTFNRDYVITTTSSPFQNSFDPTLAQFDKVGSSPKTEDDYTYAELELALCLGLNDYLRRAHIQRLCLALSGGRDSAMIAILAARLLAITNPDASTDELRKKMHDFLFTAYMPSQNSSSSNTHKAAQALAKHFGFDCHIIPIGAWANLITSAIESNVGRKLTWEKDDLTLQNVQARARSSFIWTLANARDALLLTTGNLSEAAVGYATMDGDSSGCLDPIGNIPKTIVSKWLEWARNFHQIQALDLVLAQPPSAELRPLKTKQADETDLMPYPVLDSFIQWFVIERLAPREVYQKTKTLLGSYYKNDEDIKRDIRRFIGLCTRSQWKRVRFANSFRVMPFDISEIGLQWPCVQDGFSAACKDL